LEQALVGRLQEYHRFLLTHLLSHLDFLDEEIGAVEAQLEALVARVPELAETVERLDTIPGVSWCVAVLIVAEVGLNLERFPTDRHLTAWAGLAPGNNETGGKQRPTTTRKGNRYLRRGLVQAAHGAARTRDSYFKALYHRIARRRGKQRAAVAVARSILQVAYHMMRRKETYRELGADYFDQLDRERTTKRLVRRLERLGYSVKLSAGQEGPLPESRAPSQGFAQAHTLAFS
jgi:transposase